MPDNSLRATRNRGVIHSLNTTEPLQHSRDPHQGDVAACEPHSESGRVQILAVRSQWAGTQGGRYFSPAFAKAADPIKNVDFNHADNVTNNYANVKTKSCCDICWRERRMFGMARGTASKSTKAFALRLKATRESGGFLYASALARAIGVEAPAYRKWERGEAEPGIADLVRIQKATNVSLDFLISGLAPVAASPPTFPEQVKVQAANL